METESNPMKQRRYDLSMSKRTRKPHIAMVSAQENAERGTNFAPITSQENEGKEGGLQFTPITSEANNEEEKALKCTSDKVVVEMLSASPTSRPSLKELIQVTNKEERDAKEASEQDFVGEKVIQRKKEENIPPSIINQRQIVSGVKPPGMVRRCAKALNHIIKVRYAPKQKNIAPLIAI